MSSGNFALPGCITDELALRFITREEKKRETSIAVVLKPLATYQRSLVIVDWLTAYELFIILALCNVQFHASSKFSVLLWFHRFIH